jgi:hypothetical protein
MEHSISIPKPVSRIVQLDSIPLPMSVWDVILHVILVTKQEPPDALLAMDLSNFTIQLAFRHVQMATLNFQLSPTFVQIALPIVKLVTDHLLPQIVLAVCRGIPSKDIPAKQAAIRGIQTTTQLKPVNNVLVIVKPVLEDYLRNAHLA